MSTATKRQRGLRLASPKCFLLALAACLASVSAAPPPSSFSLAAASANAAAGRGGARAAANATARQGASSATALANAGFFPRNTAAPKFKAPESARKLFEQKQAEQLALIKQQEIQNTLASLNELESQQSDSIEKCAEWFNLNQRLKQLTGGQQPKRPGEIKKKFDCDNLYKLISDMRNKLDVFKELVEAENNHLEFVGGLVSSYQELKNLAEGNPLLAKELADLEAREPKVALGTERLGQFIQFMEALLNGGGNKEPEPAPGAGAGDDEPDDFKELDRTLRDLIDKEGELSEEELGQLAELTGLLDRLLSEGHIDYNSGRYRYLTGTLEAGRGIVMHAIAAKNDTQQPETESQPEPETEPDFEREPEPKPLPLPLFVQPTPYGGAQAMAFAHAQQGPLPAPEAEPQPQPQAQPEQPKQEEKSVADQIAENIGQRVSDKLNRFKFSKRGSFAAGFASAGNGAATAGAQAASAAPNGANNTFASSLARSQPSGGFAASNAQTGDNKSGAFAATNSQTDGNNNYAASLANSNGAGQAFSQAASGRGGYASSAAQSANGGSAAALAANH